MIEAIILGIVQGIAEFLPISSSAHLILFREVFNLQMSSEIELTFDVALHFGTLLAIIIYFFKDLLKIFTLGITKGMKSESGKILWFLAIATIPAAIVGVLFENLVDEFFRKQIWLIALALIVMGIIIYVADKKNSHEKELKDLKWYHALIVGCAQVFALIPGFSRSGTTISASRMLKLNKEDAAKFSFYLAVPVILGGSVYSLIKPGTIDLITNSLDYFLVGVIISFIVGLLCIAFLLKYIKKHDFKIFMIYRVVVGILVLLWLLV